MVELTGGIGTQQRQPGTASQPGRRRNEGSPPPGYRAGHLSFVLTLGRPPVTGSVAGNRAAPDSLAHPSVDPQDQQLRHARTDHPCASSARISGCGAGPAFSNVVWGRVPDWG